MTRFEPYEYQRRAVRHLLDHRSAALWLDMGLGKSVITLTAVSELLGCLEAARVLVIAPKSVAMNIWSDEAAKWEHLSELTVAVAVGTERTRRKAVEGGADITVINRENTVWLEANYGGARWPFDTVVLDEASSFKNPTSQRFKALRRLRPYIRRIYELTGTPSPNGLMDLWAQMWLLDGGERLGRTLTAYRTRWFRPGHGSGHVVYEWRPNKGAADEITGRVSDLCLSMSADEYLRLPPMIVIDTAARLDARTMRDYKAFEKDCLMELDGQTVTAQQAAALTVKLQQFTGGGMYDTEGGYHRIHDAKVEALRDLVEAADGSPVLVFYGFTGERDMITEELSGYGPVAFRGEPDILRRWNAGGIRVLLCHPASVAYGLNMQRGGHIIVWYTATWNLELYQQANARLHRQGQGEPVRVYRISAPGTVDTDVLGALDGKRTLQDYVLEKVRGSK